MTNKKPVKWFPLDVDALEDPKVMALVMALGMEGWGIYTMLIMFLAKQEPQYVSPLDSLKYLAYRNHISEDKMKAVVQGFGLFEINEAHFYSPALIRRMEGYDNIRQMNKEKADLRWNKVRALCQSNATALPMQSQERREEKNRIEKNRKEKRREYIPPADMSFVDQLFLPAWDKWINYKKELKDPYKTVSGMKSQYSHLLKISNSDPDIAMMTVEKCIRKEWKGLFPLDQDELVKVNPGESAVDRIRKDIENAMKK